MSIRDAELRLVRSFDDACDLMRWLGQRRDVLGCDTETGGLEWWKQPLRMVQFGDRTAGWAVPFQDWSGLCKEIFDKYEGDLVFHNAKFDLHFLEVNDCPVRRDRVHDTQLMAHIVDPTRRIGLKALSDELLDQDLSHGERELKKAMSKSGWRWDTIPIDFEPYWVYSALDPVLTAYLRDEFWAPVMSQYQSVYDLESACQFVLTDMERRGARLDLGYCAQKYDELQAYADEAKSWAEQEFGVKVGSNQEVAARLIEDGVELTERTPTGKWKMDLGVLESISEKHELAATVLNVRKAIKISNTYFANFQRLADGEILHPSVKPVGARTARMSVSNSLQAVPRGRIVRDAFLAREGRRLLLIDYDQVEFRLLAHFSQDQGLIDAFAAPADFFTTMARQIFGDDELQKADPRRQLTKNAGYAKAYGAGVAKFADTAGVDPGEAKVFLQKLDATFPGITRLQRDIENLAMQRKTKEGTAYVVSPSGRRHPADDGYEYRLVNALIQGTAADLLKEVIVDLDAAGLADHLILPVHDELIFDVPAEDVEEARTEIARLMESDDYAVPLTVGTDVVDRWGGKYE